MLTDSNHLLLNLLPNPWDPEKQRRLDLLQGVGQGSLQGVFVGKVCGALAGHQHEDVQDVGGHVAQR